MLSAQRCVQSVSNSRLRIHLVRRRVPTRRDDTSCVKACALIALLCWSLTAVAQETPPNSSPGIRQKTPIETDRPNSVASDATAKVVPTRRDADTSSAAPSPPTSLTASSATGHKRLSEPPTAVRKGSGSPPAQNSSSVPSAQSKSQKNPPTTSAPNGPSGQAVSSSERSTPTRRESTTHRTRRESRSEPSQKNDTPTTTAPAPKTQANTPAAASVTVAPKANPQSQPVGNGRRVIPNEFNDVLRTLDADRDNSSRDNSSRDSHGAASSGWFSGLWLVIKLAIVVGLIYLTVYVLKLWMTKKPFTLGMAAKGDIKVLETVGLGPNRALHLVTIGEQKLLLASTANAVQLICEVESPDAPALAAAPPTANGTSPQFADALRALQEVAGRNGDTAEIAASGNGRDGRALLREKILKLRESSP